MPPLPPTPFHVLIVAKTHLRRGFCVGAIAENGRSLRLDAPDFETPHFNAEYEIGDVWRIEQCSVPRECVLPHTEDIVVHRKRKVKQSSKLLETIYQQMPPVCGDVERLFDGAVRQDEQGRLYIGPGQVPGYSTLFWCPDQPLSLCSGPGDRFQYSYPGTTGKVTLSYTGTALAAHKIPAGSLVRISVARWWKPETTPWAEARCHLQVSGWFSQSDAADEAAPTPPGVGAHLARHEPVHADTHQLLREVFGFREFRPYQQAIIATVLARRDALVVMSTGAGKSLCYQLPALVLPGLTIVVSPLISLMHDQVAHLHEAGIVAAMLNSSQLPDARQHILARLRRGELRLLYVAPETLTQAWLLRLLQTCNIACLVVDEAHCISRWGHDFRPEYRELGRVRHALGDVPTLALTATATPQVQADIVANLALENVETFIAPFDRPNLFLATQPRQNGGLAQVLQFLNEHQGQSGIIYCATRKQVDALTAELQTQGIAAQPYHAGLDDTIRHAHQQRFLHDEVRVIVATVAFGMGIDKPDVRFVLHYSVPSDPESYFQQIGRAGRDGERADCLLLYGPQDFRTHKFLIAHKEPELQPPALARLEHMRKWLMHVGCRRQWLNTYFGDISLADTCAMCDGCLAITQSAPLAQAATELDDITAYARLLLECVHQVGQSFGASHVISILRGSRKQSLIGRGHAQLPAYGKGKQFSRGGWQHLLRQLFAQQLLVQNAHGALRLTPRGRAVLQGASVLGELQPNAEADTDMPSELLSDELSRLMMRLRALRQELARARSIPAYIICGDRTLHELAARRPTTPAALRLVFGLGEYKIAAYGEQILAVIREFCNGSETSTEENGTRSQQGSREATSLSMATCAPGPLSTRLQEIRLQHPRAGEKWQPSEETDLQRCFLQGATIADLARQFGRVPGAIEARLVRLGLIPAQSSPAQRST